MNLLYKSLIFAGLVIGDVVFVLPGLKSAPSIYSRLFTLFIVGAVFAVFIEGPKYGTMQPISTRPIMIALGILVMGGSVLWAMMIRGHL